MSRFTFFPDTNFFLQYRDAVELPWRSITDASEVALLICRGVQGEIDDLKGNGNTRRAGRARRVSAQFRTIVLSRDPLLLRAADPRVVLDFAPRPPIETATTGGSFTKADDQIVAEALAAAALVDGDAALLTDDTGMMLTARERGMAFVPTPEEWRLPPERDERDKQIGELRAEIARLSQSSPRLNVEASSSGQPLIGPLVVRRIEYQPLRPEVVEEFTKALETRYPLKTDFSREADDRIAMAQAMKIANRRTVAGLMASYVAGHLGSEEWKPPSESSIEDYHDAYAKWLAEVRRLLEGLHATLPGLTGGSPISFSLQNVGSVPADQVLVDIEALGGLLLERRPKENAASKPNPALPAMPEAPGWKAMITGPYRSTVETLRGAMGGAHPFGHESSGLFVPPFHPGAPHVDDPHSFYWRDGAPSRRLSEWGYRCGELRHHAEGKVLTAIVVAPADSSVTRGAIRFRASARNLPEPIERIVAVRVEVEAGDSETAARALMPRPA